jgi:sodium/hydrogen exchanger 8
VPLILWCLPILLLARALNVFPMVAMVNARRKPIHKMPFTQQVMMWFSGLRGALAFSLTLHIPTGAEALIRTTTLVIVFFTVLVLGGATVPMLKALKIKVCSGFILLSTFVTQAPQSSRIQIAVFIFSQMIMF